MSFNVLFWEWWSLSNIYLTDTAKNTMSTSLTMSLLRKLALEWKLINEESFINILDEVKTWITQLTEYSKLNTGMKWGIAWADERNRIFMDNIEGLEFFSILFEGEFKTSENIHSYIREKSLEPASQDTIENNIEGVEEKMWNIQQIIEDFENPTENPHERNLPNQWESEVPVDNTENDDTQVASGDTAQYSDDLDTAQQNAESAETEEEKTFWEQIGEMLIKILESVWNAAISDSSESSSDSSTEESWETSTEVPQTEMETVEAILDESTSLGVLGNISGTEAFLQNPENTEKIRDIIDAIPANGDEATFEQKLQNILTGKTGSGQDKLINFTETTGWEPIQNADGSLNEANFLNALSSYKDYRVAYSQEPGLTYEAFGAK